MEVIELQKINNVLNEHIEYFNDEEVKNKLKDFKTEILSNYSRKFSIKKLFSQNMLYGVNRVIFESISSLLEYNNLFNSNNEEMQFNTLNLNQGEYSLVELLNIIIENVIKQETLNIIIQDIDLLYNNIETIDTNLLESLKINCKNFNFKIEYNIQKKILNDENFEKLKNLFFRNSQVVIDYIIDIINYQDHQEDIISLYEDSANIFRFYRILFDYKSLKNLTLDEMNRFKYYNSFLQRWINTTNQKQNKQNNGQNYNGFQLTPINVFNNKVKSSLFIDKNNNVYIDEKFQQNKEYKLFNFVEDKDKTGEDIPYYNLSLLYQQLIMNELNFIRNFSTETQPLIYDQLDYYYNLTENNSIQNLSQEVEFLHQTVLRNLHNINWKWGNK